MEIKHKYSVYGVSRVGDSFTGTCVADDIIKAIELFKEKECSVLNIERKERVDVDATIEITSLNILGDTMKWNMIEAGEYWSEDERFRILKTWDRIHGNNWQLTDYNTKENIACDSLKHCKQVTEMIMQGKR